MATVTTINAIFNPVMWLMNEVIKKEDTRQILQTGLTGMEGLVQALAFLGYEEKEPPEVVKIWLQLLQSSLTVAKGLFDLEPRSTLSQEIRDWKAFFDHLYEGFQNDLLQHIALSGNAINSRMVAPVMEQLKDVINKEDNRHILQTDLRQMEGLLQDITTLFRDEPDIAILFQHPRKELLKIVKRWFQLLQSSLAEAKGLFDLDPTTHSQEIREWSTSFDKMYHSLQSELSRLVTSLQFVSSKPFYAYKEEDASVGSGIIADEAQPLSKDEAWMLFRRVAFKGVHVSMDIRKRARNIAEECRGLPLSLS